MPPPLSKNVDVDMENTASQQNQTMISDSSLNQPNVIGNDESLDLSHDGFDNGSLNRSITSQVLSQNQPFPSGQQHSQSMQGNFSSPPSNIYNNASKSRA